MFLQIRARKMEGLSYLPLHISHLLSHFLFTAVKTSLPLFLFLARAIPRAPRLRLSQFGILSLATFCPFLVLSLASPRDPRRAIAASKRSL